VRRGCAAYWHTKTQPEPDWVETSWTSTALPSCPGYRQRGELVRRARPRRPARSGRRRPGPDLDSGNA
jgi:hypothetical protein